MRAGRPSKRGNKPWRKVALNLAMAGATVSAHPLGKLCEGMPVSAWRWSGDRGRLRRVIVTYAGGETANIFFRLDSTIGSFLIKLPTAPVPNREMAA